MRQVLLAFLIMPSLVMAQPRIDQAASDELDQVHSWHNLDQWRKKYAPKYDDGFYAEGIADFVEKMLVNHWRSLPELVSLSHKSPGLFKFSVAHLGEITTCESTKKILRSTLVGCPKGYANYCGQIRQQLLTSRTATECLPEQLQPNNSFKADTPPLRGTVRP